MIIDNAAHSEEEDDDNFMVEEGTQDTLVPEREETMAPPSEEDGQHGRWSGCLLSLGVR